MAQPLPLPPLAAPTEKQPGKPPRPLPPSRRLGIAVVGLGNLAMTQIILTLSDTKYCKLTALVSGSPDKAAEVAAQHGLPARSIYTYQT